jgi:hypothetical protein
MPFIHLMNPITNQLHGYYWTVHPEILEDTSDIDPNVVILQIESISTIPTRIPSLDFFNTGNLYRLEIEDMDITDMPRIPNSVTWLKLKNTTITNLNQINVNWYQIQWFEIDNNVGLNGSSLILPEGIQTISIRKQKFDIIRFPSTIRIVKAYSININQFTGYLPTSYMDFWHMSQFTKYFMGYKLIKQQIDIELEENWNGPLEPLKKKWCNILTQHIKHINNVENYRIYEEIGSIKHRIINPIEHRDNPIVAALFLGSNYLRRAAEFITEETNII